MLKVFGFGLRSSKLTHDEYRAAHIGYHASHGRRLNHIRGYLVNIRANRDLADLLGDNGSELSGGEATNFDDRWDGYSQFMFDSHDVHLAAKAPSLDKAGPMGLERDDAAVAMGEHASFLYSAPPFQFHVVESVVTPVRRPEYKLFKLVQFGKRKTGVTRTVFQSLWSDAYSALSRDVPGLLGHIINYPAYPDVGRRCVAEDFGALSSEAELSQAAFMHRFDGIAELWFTDPEAFIGWRRKAGSALREIETDLFAGFCLREVDETVAVLPDRLPPPSFYHR